MQQILRAFLVQEVACGVVPRRLRKKPLLLRIQDVSLVAAAVVRHFDVEVKERCFDDPKAARPTCPPE